jgi:hypothetical protein
VTRSEFMRRLLAAPVVGFVPRERRRQPVAISTHVHVDGREIARDVHRRAAEAKANRKGF